MNEPDFRQHLITQLERIATALEAANESDPLLAVMRAIERPDVDVAQLDPLRDVPPLTAQELAASGPSAIDADRALNDFLGKVSGRPAVVDPVTWWTPPGTPPEEAYRWKNMPKPEPEVDPLAPATSDKLTPRE